MPDKISKLNSSGPYVEEVNRPSLKNNKDAIIKNPLSGIFRETLLRDVEVFANKFGMTAILPELRKGALVAQNPQAYETIEGLDDADRQALHNEVTHKWRQPRALWYTIVVCSIGAMVQGWDQTGANGANLSFPQVFGIGSTSSYDRWIVGLINSSPNIAMGLIGCWMSDPLNLYFGRRGTIFASGVFCLLSVLGSAFTQRWEQLLVCRLLLGVGMGLKSSTVSVFAAETSPAPIRGALVMSWQLWVAFGIFIGFSANLAVVDTGDIAWRLQLGSAFIPAVPLCILVFFCPESPRWYMKKGYYQKAYNSLCKYRHTPLQAARDLYTIHTQLIEEHSAVAKGETYIRRFYQLFTVPRIRRATLAASVVMLCQQLSGITVIAYYSSTIFTEAGVSQRNGLWASWGFGLVNFIFAWPAVFTIDTFGRRSLLLFTFPHLSWTLLVAGLCYLVHGDTLRLGLVATFIYIYTMFYSPGIGPVCYPYAAEVFPLSHREMGMAMSISVTSLSSFVLSLTFPRMLTVFTSTGAFGFYCGLSMLAFIIIFLWLPETKQRTLEGLDYVFAVPTAKFMYYQITKAAPWWIRRWIRQQRNAKLEPLYHFDSDRDNSDSKVDSSRV